ncbi:MAG: hypothetical protein U0521_01810 [Anaerolineae bacterium]
MLIKTEYGWLLFYHGHSEGHIYRHSVALLDLDDPTKVINRPTSYIIEPTETGDQGRRGQRRKPAARTTSSAMSCGSTTPGDRVIGLATAPFAEVVDFARTGRGADV